MSNDREIFARTVSGAWLAALEAMLAIPAHAAIHFAVRVADPSAAEDIAIRAVADRLLARGRLQSITSVRNTIFPAAWARRLPDPNELAAHYREHYPTLRRFPKNKAGTYFGRLVAYPMGTDEGRHGFDQLSDLLCKLRRESSITPGRTRARRLSSCYEVNIWKPGDLPSGMGFPCMSHLSFHLVGGRLHLLAQYRNQFLIERAYGNYLGLAQLLSYISAAVGLKPGELMVLASHASLDTHPQVSITAIRAAVAELAEQNGTRGRRA